MFEDKGYAPERDDVPVSAVSSYEFAIAVGAATPVRDLSELIAWLLPGWMNAMRQAWEDWNASMPPIPGDATVSLVSSLKDMPQR